MNTAAGVMATMKEAGFFASPLAMIVAAMGAAQVALIQKQKFQGGGGNVEKPTMTNLTIGKRSSAVDVTERDLETFVEQMTTSQLQSIMDFFDTMPKLRHVIQVTNPNTKKKGEVVVEGLQNFLG